MKLRIRDSGAAAALRRRMALDRCSDPAGLGMSSPALSVPRCSAREPYQCDTVPLTAPEVALAGTACTLLTVIDPERRARSSVEGLIACYGLTGAEAEVCRLIADGFQAREIADQRRVGLSTVKTQTRAIFSKTRTRNRAELVRRAITLVPPLD
jgi:DNA-binding CsgD family transcriptional regulator